MPAFNAEATLRTAIRSTLLALPRDGEIIVINDGSRDATLSVVEHERARDKRVRIIDMGANRGIATALNAGLYEADCKYAARMDADDVCLPWRIRYAIRSIKRNKSDLVFTSVASFSSYTHVRPSVPIEISAKAMELHLLLVNPVAHSTMVGKKTCLETLGGYRDVPSEDYDLWMRAVASGTRVSRLPMPSQLYRKHAGQITAQEEWQKLASINTLTADAHRDLCQVVLGEDIEAFGSLRLGKIDSPEVQRLFQAVSDAMEDLDTYDRVVLGRQMRVCKAKYVSDSKN